MSNADDKESKNPRDQMKRKHSVDLSEDRKPSKKHVAPTFINLTSHGPAFNSHPVPLKWGAEDPDERGPVVATNRSDDVRNAIGAHGGSYCVYRALAAATGKLDLDHFPQLELTQPPFKIGPFPSWFDPEKIVTMDPFGHLVASAFKKQLDKGYDIRPSIAVTQAHIDVPEVKEALRVGRLKADGKILLDSGVCMIRKAAIEPVWYLPGIAKRFGVEEAVLRQSLFTHTNGMYPELITRTDLKVYMPPIGGNTIYMFGDTDAITDPNRTLTVRVHDECNGSDVFGSDICTCRPYLAHAIEECIRTAQAGGAGIIIYYRKEGRSLGEVTKYLVYNMRKRQEGGDSAAEYFNCTKHVAGIEDVRFQQLMVDPLHWLGVTKIDKLVSMSDMKYNAITSSGIEVVERVAIPPELVPADAQVEIHAKVFAGYGANGVKEYEAITEESLKGVMGREYKSDDDNDQNAK